MGDQSAVAEVQRAPPPSEMSAANRRRLALRRRIEELEESLRLKRELEDDFGGGADPK